MKRVVAVAGTAVCALLAALAVHLWSTSSDIETADGHPAAPRLSRAPRISGLADGEVTAPTGALAIRGVVTGPAGPIAGVVVAAFAASEAAPDPLAHAVCPEAKPEDDPYDCASNDDASRAIADVFASRSLERPALARATTDAEGRFALEGLAAGSYDVWAEREGGFASSMSQDAPADDVELELEPGVLLEGKVEVDDGPPKGPLLVSGAAVGFPRIFEAETGEGGAFSLGPMPAADSAVVSTLLEGYLGASEVLSDTEEHSSDATEIVLSLASPRRLTGVVLDDGRPAAGVTVALDGDLDAVPDAVTDASGRFVFERVRPGDFSIEASKPFLVGQENVVVPADRDPPEVIVDLRPVGLVRGFVRDEAGRPVPEASIFLAGHEVVHAGADGRFELTEAGSSERLIARAEGFLPLDEDLEVSPGEVLERDITLRRAIVLRGTVMDEAGQPIRFAGISVREDESNDGSQTSTDREGAFELETATARAEVEVEARGYVAARRTLTAGTRERIVLRAGGQMVVRLLDTEGKPVQDANVVAVPLRGSQDRRTAIAHRDAAKNEYLLAGLTAGDYRLEVRTESALEVRLARSDGRARQELEVKLPALGKIDGKVVGPGGEPMTDAYVRANEVLEGGRVRSGTGGRTDERGEFHLGGRRGSQYQLFVLKDNRPPVTGFPVTVDGAPVTVVIPAAAKVHGRVLYPDGAPASVFTINGERFRGPEGRFEQEVSPGDAHLLLGAPGHAPQALSISLREGEDRDLGDLTLNAGRTVAVRVLDARTSAPVSGATVHVSGFDESGDSSMSSSLEEPFRRTRSDGSTALTHVPAHAVLSVEADGYQPASAEVGQGTSEVVRLEPNETMRVFLDDPFDGPLWAAVEGPEDQVLPLDPTAGATFRGLPSGEYTVVLWKSPPRPHQKWNGTLAPVQPKTVLFPNEGGGNDVHFQMRTTGTDVVLQLAGVAPDAESQLLLVPNGVDLAELVENPLNIKMEQIVVPERPGRRGPARFANVPDGTYRAAAMIFGTNTRGMYVHPQPLVLKAGGGPREVAMTVPDDWRPEQD